MNDLVRLDDIAPIKKITSDPKSITLCQQTRMLQSVLQGSSMGTIWWTGHPSSFWTDILRALQQQLPFLWRSYPTEQEVKTWYAPLAQKILMEYSMKEERFFCHLASPSSSSLGKTWASSVLLSLVRRFKGGMYRYIHSAFDSKTQERMVVYQALYGEMAYWVLPEKMFFEKVTRDGRIFNRFTEIDR